MDVPFKEFQSNLVSLTFISKELTLLSWPVMIAEIIQRFTHVPAVPGSNLGWSRVTCFYSIAYINIPRSVANTFLKPILSIIIDNNCVLCIITMYNMQGLVSLENHNFLQLNFLRFEMNQTSVINFSLTTVTKKHILFFYLRFT